MEQKQSLTVNTVTKMKLTNNTFAMTVGPTAFIGIDRPESGACW